MTSAKKPAREARKVWLVEHLNKRRWVATAWGIHDNSPGFGTLSQARFGLREARAQYVHETYRIRGYIPADANPRRSTRRKRK